MKTVFGSHGNIGLSTGFVLASAGLLVAACSGGSNPPPLSQTPEVCIALTGRTFDAALLGAPSTGAVVTSATYVKAVPDALNAAGTGITQGLPDYCKLLIDIKPVDATAPTTKVQVNLPTAWNGKKLQLGGGGFNGTLVTGLAAATNAPLDVPLPLVRGYMIAGTDSGHQASAYPEAQAFGLNNESFLNYAYASYKNTHDVAVQAALAYYGAKPTKSYYMGGSEGGREGLTMVQRYPADFDAVFSLAPVINFVGLQTFGNWVGGIKQTGGGWLGTKVQLVHDTVMSACDALDGLTDGVVNNYVACKPLADAALTAKRCPSGADEGATCLSDAQLSAVNGTHAGYTFNFPLANGVTSYPGFAYGGEGLAGNWSSWLTGTVAPTFTVAPNISGIGNLFSFGNGVVRYFIAQNKDFNPLTYDPNAYMARVQAVSAVMDSTNPDLTTFMNRGGKLILADDMADTAQSPYAGLNYSTSVVAKMGSTAVNSFMRTYALPGLPHTSSGIAASTTPVNAPAYGIPARYDWLAALDAWSTNGTPPPDQPVVTTTGALPPYTVTASKPVCLYPNYPRYTGTGTSGGNLASNYSCVAP